jgi:hypothetical protein
MPLAADPDRALVWAHDCVDAGAAAAASSLLTSGAPLPAALPPSASDCNFAFLQDAVASRSIVANISRIPKDAVVHTTPESSAFSPEGAYLAQVSGNAYTGTLQLLVASGQAVVNSNIPGLKEALCVATESPCVSVSIACCLLCLHSLLISLRCGPFHRCNGAPLISFCY